MTGQQPAEAPMEIRQLILEMSVANPAWESAKDSRHRCGHTTVAKYAAKRRRPPSQGLKTFLRNHADGSHQMDLFVVCAISFRVLYELSCRDIRDWSFYGGGVTKA
jgi:hypothetical protein